MISRDEFTRIVIDIGPELKRLLYLENPEVWLDIDLTMVQFKSLILILNQRNMTPSGLARALGVTPANMTGVVERLVKMGLVRRAGSPNDRRVLRLKATEKAQTLVARTMERSADDMSSILQLMTTVELAHLAKGLTALVNAARKRRAFSEGATNAESGETATE